ncbi:hypothetical protein PFISCL1PPCAC_22327, partial [Pristionchus fissidentatus]
PIIRYDEYSIRLNLNASTAREGIDIFLLDEQTCEDVEKIRTILLKGSRLVSSTNDQSFISEMASLLIEVWRDRPPPLPFRNSTGFRPNAYARAPQSRFEVPESGRESEQEKKWSWRDKRRHRKFKNWNN